MVKIGLPFSKLANILLVIAIIIIISLAVLPNLNKLSNWFTNLGFGPGNEDISTTKVQERFSNLKEIVNNCFSKNTNNCFCTNENILFPTSYRLELSNNINNQVTISLLSDKKERIDSFSLAVEGCNLIKKNKEKPVIDDLLAMVYGQKLVIEYKREKFVFDSKFVFYKENNRFCIVEKAMLSSLNKDNIC